MNNISGNIEEIKKFPTKHVELIEEILNKINLIYNGRRKIMYSDIINFIFRKGYEGESINQLIIWCNYKIRCGEIFIEY